MAPETKLSPQDIPPCFYRISAKALILDETRTKFLVVQEEDGRWDLPGGGIDHGELPTDALRREIQEEMSLTVMTLHEQPTYFLTFLNVTGYWLANALYETTVRDLKFTPSNECIAIMFVTAEEAKKLNAYPNVVRFAEIFDAKKHQ